MMKSWYLASAVNAEVCSKEKKDVRVLGVTGKENHKFGKKGRKVWVVQKCSQSKV